MASTPPDTADSLDLDMLAYDISDMLDRCGYDQVDAGIDDIRAALPAFLAQLQAAQEPRR